MTAPNTTPPSQRPGHDQPVLGVSVFLRLEVDNKVVLDAASSPVLAGGGEALLAEVSSFPNICAIRWKNIVILKFTIIHEACSSHINLQQIATCVSL